MGSGDEDASVDGQNTRAHRPRDASTSMSVDRTPCLSGRELARARRSKRLKMERLMVPSRLIERPPATISRQKSWSRTLHGRVRLRGVLGSPPPAPASITGSGRSSDYQATPTRIVYRVFPHVRIKHVWYLGRSCSKKERDGHNSATVTDRYSFAFQLQSPGRGKDAARSLRAAALDSSLHHGHKAEGTGGTGTRPAPTHHPISISPTATACWTLHYCIALHSSM
jgi:hypothetical protein